MGASLQIGGLGLCTWQLLGIGSQMSKKPIEFIADMWVYSNHKTTPNRALLKGFSLQAWIY